jgi:hypothetical protein
MYRSTVFFLNLYSTVIYRAFARFTLIAIISLTGCGADSKSAFRLAATVSGLKGSGLVLEVNGHNGISVSTDGAVTLVYLLSGYDYSVTVKTPPTNPSQNCTVTNANGTMGSADVGLTVACSTNAYTIGGTATGLIGSGLTLQVDNQQQTPQSLALNGDANGNANFTFTTPLESGSTYSVIVVTQPTEPAQTCNIANGTGRVTTADISNLFITCSANQYTIGGSIVGLVGSGLVLRLNGQTDLAASGNGTFTFGTPIASNSTYSVVVAAQPSGPTQTCTIANGTGKVTTEDAGNVVVTCSVNAYAVGGSVSSLAGSGLVLRLNGQNDLAIDGNGSYSFAAPVESGAAYAVTVATQPSGPGQLCTVANGTGWVSSGVVSNIDVVCRTCGTGPELVTNGDFSQANGANWTVVYGPLVWYLPGKALFGTGPSLLQAYAIRQAIGIRTTGSYLFRFDFGQLHPNGGYTARLTVKIGSSPGAQDILFRELSVTGSYAYQLPDLSEGPIYLEFLGPGPPEYLDQPVLDDVSLRM